MKFLWLPLVAILGACTPRPIAQAQDTAAVSDSIKPISNKPISQVLADHTADWMNIPGVVGTGETVKDGKPAILIFVDSLTDDLKSRLPSSVEGYLVVIHQSGTVKALPAK